MSTGMEQNVPPLWNKCSNMENKIGKNFLNVKKCNEKNVAETTFNPVIKLLFLPLVIAGRHPCHFLEELPKGRLVGEVELVGNLLNVVFGREQ